MLDRVRARKVSLLRDNPDVLRKSDTGARRSSAEPRWFGLPCVEPEVREMVKAARDRQSEERRLAKASGRNMPGEPDGAMRQALRWPIVGNRGLIATSSPAARAAFAQRGGLNPRH